MAGGSALLTGALPASAVPLAYRWEHGPTPALESSTPTRAAPPGPARGVSERIDRLPAGAVVHQRLVVSSVGGVTRGADRPFATPGGPPPAAAAGPVHAARPAPRPAAVRRPAARLLRGGGAWVLRLGLPSRTTVRVVVARRVTRAGRGPARLRLVRRIGPRTVGAGVRRVRLGRLAPGRYRVLVRMRGPAGRGTLTRALLVPPTRRGAR
ncbi:hypothetical protein [Miltoncostaea marina]|uniref:hypothetical protein n=1 Tax=Miltoncostaea marina TaxID=2843215 RepID=UPI001C3C7C9A|nr:hypothetical protein [Miltoncostaea marina]